MLTFMGRNVNETYMLAMHSMASGHGIIEMDSRNGPIKEFDYPVVSYYLKPRERVLFDATRDCNPFLHFFESLWMLAGRRDLSFLTQFTKQFEEYSDDGETLNGAYGYRWRSHFGYDQIEDAITELKKNPESRRVVTAMWDGDEDKTSKDIPCNTSIMWRVRRDTLDMTVTNRSNDMIWGCYGANAVHFSFIHEYVASCIGRKVGTYYQVSNSLHVYTDFEVTKRCFAKIPDYNDRCPYQENRVNPYPLFWGGAEKVDFDMDLHRFFKTPEADGTEYSTRFFQEVVAPMWQVFTHYKSHSAERALKLHDYVAASDWQLAVKEWLERRIKK